MKIVIPGVNIWLGLCWLGGLFHGFDWPLWFLGECCGSVLLSGRRLFWDPDRCGHWGFQVKMCFLVLVDSNIKTEMVQRAEGLAGGRKAWFSTSICLVPWNKGRE